MGMSSALLSDYYLKVHYRPVVAAVNTPWHRCKARTAQELGASARRLDRSGNLPIRRFADLMQP